MLARRANGRPLRTPGDSTLPFIDLRGPQDHQAISLVSALGKAANYAVIESFNAGSEINV